MSVIAVERRLSPLLVPSEFAAPESARSLEVRRCEPWVARSFIAAWHSRLPRTQVGPWKLAFVAHYSETCFAAALWHNPSARGLPDSWLELRRLAVADDAPHCTASFMLSRMARWVRANLPEVDRLLSYQDTAVHLGTIYKAAGWRAAHVAKARARDRSKPRVGTRRDYRSNLNGVDPDASEKVRWELVLR